MKRTAASLLAAVMTAGMIAGCGGNSAGTDSTTAAPGDSTQTADKEKSTAEDKTVYPAGTITIYGTGQPQYLQ